MPRKRKGSNVYAGVPGPAQKRAGVGVLAPGVPSQAGDILRNHSALAPHQALVNQQQSISRTNFVTQAKQALGPNAQVDHGKARVALALLGFHAIPSGHSSLQDALQALGNASGPGVTNPNDIKKYQQTVGLKATGRFDMDTYASLMHDTATLGPGSLQSLTQATQRQSGDGRYTVPYDPSTMSAKDKAYADAHGLTGRVQDNTTGQFLPPGSTIPSESYDFGSKYSKHLTQTLDLLHLGQETAARDEYRRVADLPTADRVGAIGKAWPTIPADVVAALGKEGYGPTDPQTVQVAMLATKAMAPDPRGDVQALRDKQTQWLTEGRISNESSAADPSLDPKTDYSKSPIFQDYIERNKQAQDAAAKKAQDSSGPGGIGGFLEGAAREGFAALSAPYEELQGAFRSAVSSIASLPATLQGLNQGLPGSIRNTAAPYMPSLSGTPVFDTQSALGIQLENAIGGDGPTSLGGGILPSTDSPVYQEQAARARQALSIDGHAGTPGRLLAHFVTEPGTAEYNALSGVVDAASIVATDPANAILGRLSEARQAAKVFSPTVVQEGLEEAGLFNRAMRHIIPQTFDQWTASPKGSRMIEHLAGLNEPTDFEHVRDIVNGDGKLASKLIDAQDTSSVTQTLRETAGSELRQVPTMPKVSNPLSNVRLLQSMPGRVYDLEDPSSLIETATNVQKNAKLSADTISANNYRLAKAESQPDKIAALNDIHGQVIDKLTTYRPMGVFAPMAQDAAKKLINSQIEVWQKAMQAGIEELGNQRNLPGLMIDEGVKDMGGPSKLIDMLDRTVPAGDTREIRRAISFLAPLFRYRLLGATAGGLGGLATGVELGDSPLDTAALAGGGAVAGAFPRETESVLDSVYHNAFKPLMLVTRLAYPIRIIGEEQLRMLAADYDSMVNSPVSWLAWVTGRKGGVVDRDLFEESALRDFKDGFGRAMSTNTGPQSLLQEAGGRVVLKGRTVYTKNVDEPFAKSWGMELAKRNYGDPITQKIMGMEPDEAKQWFYNGGGKDLRNDVIRKGGDGFAPLATPEGSDAYIEFLRDQANVAAGGDPELLQAIHTGKIGDIPLLQRSWRGMKINKDALDALSAKEANGIGPAFISGDKIGFANQSSKTMDEVWGHAFHVMMGAPLDHLARGPMWKQAYWRRIAEGAAFLSESDAARAASKAREELTWGGKLFGEAKQIVNQIETRGALAVPKPPDLSSFEPRVADLLAHPARSMLRDEFPRQPDGTFAAIETQPDQNFHEAVGQLTDDWEKSGLASKQTIDQARGDLTRGFQAETPDAAVRHSDGALQGLITDMQAAKHGYVGSSHIAQASYYAKEGLLPESKAEMALFDQRWASGNPLTKDELAQSRVEAQGILKTDHNYSQAIGAEKRRITMEAKRFAGEGGPRTPNVYFSYDDLGDWRPPQIWQVNLRRTDASGQVIEFSQSAHGATAEEAAQSALEHQSAGSPHQWEVTHTVPMPGGRGYGQHPSGQWISGHVVGPGLDRQDKLPDVLYHASPEAESIKAHGMITPGQEGVTGLAGNNQNRNIVSLTTSRAYAEQVLSRVGAGPFVEFAGEEGPTEISHTLFMADQGVITKAWNQQLPANFDADTWMNNMTRELKNSYAEMGPEYANEIQGTHDSLVGLFAKHPDIYSPTSKIQIYTQEMSTNALADDEMTNIPSLAAGKPRGGIVEVRRSDIPQNALVTHIGGSEHEVRVHADVPVRNEAGELAMEPPQAPLTLDHLDRVAKAHALEQVRKTMYDLHNRSQMFDVMRFAFPFGDAMKQFFTRWGGLAVDHPEIFRKFQIGVQGAKDSGFFYKNDQGQEVFAYPFTGQISKALVGAPVPLEGQFSGLNLALSGPPQAGPLVSVPAAYFVPDTPNMDWLNNYLFPYGRPQSGDLLTNTVDALTPAWLDKFREYMGAPEFQADFAKTTMRIDSYYATTGDYGNSAADLNQRLRDAKEAAKKFLVFRAVAQNIVPSAPIPKWQILDKDGHLQAVNVLSKKLRDLQNSNYDTSAEQFIKEYGMDTYTALEPLTQAITYALPATKDGTDWARNHQDAVTKYPYVYGFFAPTTGKPDLAAFGDQVDRGERNILDPGTRQRLMNDSMARYMYDREAKGYGDSPTKEQADYLKKYKGWLQIQFPGYNSDVGKIGHATTAEMDAQLHEAIADPALKNTPTGKALTEYYDARKYVQDYAAKYFHLTDFTSSAKTADLRTYLKKMQDYVTSKYPASKRVFELVYRKDTQKLSPTTHNPTSNQNVTPSALGKISSSNNGPTGISPVHHNISAISADQGVVPFDHQPWEPTHANIPGEYGGSVTGAGGQGGTVATEGPHHANPRARTEALGFPGMLPNGKLPDGWKLDAGGVPVKIHGSIGSRFRRRKR